MRHPVTSLAFSFARREPISAPPKPTPDNRRPASQGPCPCCTFSAKQISFRSPGIPRHRPASRAFATSFSTLPSDRSASSARPTSADPLGPRIGPLSATALHSSSQRLLLQPSPLVEAVFFRRMTRKTRAVNAKTASTSYRGMRLPKNAGHSGKTHRRFAQTRDALP